MKIDCECIRIRFMFSTRHISDLPFVQLTGTENCVSIPGDVKIAFIRDGWGPNQELLPVCSESHQSDASRAKQKAMLTMHSHRDL